MIEPTISSANVSPTHKGADSRGCIIGPPPASASKREVGARARPITRQWTLHEYCVLKRRYIPLLNQRGLPNLFCAKSALFEIPHLCSFRQQTPAGLDKYLGSSDDVGIISVFAPMMTDASDRRHEQHAGRHDGGENLRVVTG